MEETLSFQLLSTQAEISIERLHICTWEVGTHKPIIEFGLDINNDSINNLDRIDFSLYTPWNINQCSDLFSEIKEEENARFIFNEAIDSKENINGNPEFGVIHYFSNNTNLCILPIQISHNSRKIDFSINLQHYKKHSKKNNVYIRFYLIPDNDVISIQKNGIAKSTIIYDTKVNERRNIPTDFLTEITNLNYPKIVSCYNFNIVQINMVISFEDKHLKSVRNLEYKSFSAYFRKLIQDKKIKIENRELLVVFHKHSSEDSTYSFFSIYTKEHFGLKQISIVLLLNLFCSFLFFSPSYRGRSYNHNESIWNNFFDLPFELLLILLILLAATIYIFNPRNIFKR